MTNNTATITETKTDSEDDAPVTLRAFRTPLDAVLADAMLLADSYRVRVTPGLARALLGRAVTRRRLNQERISAFAQAMARGHWQSGVEAICVDKNGRVVDGRHRLEAVVRSGVSVDFRIIVGVEAA